MEQSFDNVNNTKKIFGYVRVSTDEQTIESQKECIRDYCEASKRRWMVDKWIEASISSRESLESRRIAELIAELQPGDILLASELTRLARSNWEAFNIVNQIFAKGAEIHLIKNNLVINGQNKNDPFNNLILSVFAMFGQFERDIISSRTKDGIARARREGKQIGKKKGTIQSSKYDCKTAEIIYLLKKGQSYQDIINMIGFGNRKGLFRFVKTRGLMEKARKLGESVRFELTRVAA